LLTAVTRSIAHADKRVWRGIAVDNSYVYTSTDRNTSFALQNIISVYDHNLQFVTEYLDAYTELSDAGKFMSCADLTVHDRSLLVTVCDFNAGVSASYQSRVVIYDLDNMPNYTQHEIGSGVAECCLYHDNHYYVCYRDLAQINQYDLSFNLVKTHNLTIPGVNQLDGLYQSIKFIDGQLWANLRGPDEIDILAPVHTPGLDIYDYNGVDYTHTQRTKSVTAGAGQGFDVHNDIFYFVDRPDNSMITAYYEDDAKHYGREYATSIFKNRAADLDSNDIETAINKLLKTNVVDRTLPQRVIERTSAVEKQALNDLVRRINV